MALDVPTLFDTAISFPRDGFAGPVTENTDTRVPAYFGYAMFHFPFDDVIPRGKIREPCQRFAKKTAFGVNFVNFASCGK